MTAAESPGAGVSAPHSVELAVSDRAEARSLRQWLSQIPGADVSVRSGTPAPGSLGTLDTLVLAGSSAGVVAAIKVIPDFLRSRRSKVTVTATVNGQPFTLEADNIKNVTEIVESVERLLDE